MPSGALSQERAQEIVLGQPLLRFYFDQSPGFGHQAHTSLMIRRIKQAGFNGRIEVLFLEPMKMTVFFPNFDPQKSEQYDQENNIRFIQLFESPWVSKGPSSTQAAVLAKVPFVLTGGQDSHRFNNRYLTEVLAGESMISLNPYAWSSESYVQEADGRRLDLESIIDLSITPSTFRWQGEVVDQELVTRLEAIQETHHVFPFYGHEAVVEELLHKLVTSLEVTSLPKGIVVPVFNKMSDKQLQRLEVKLNRQWGFDSQSPQSVQIVNIGPVGQLTFNQIFSNKKFKF